MACFLFYMVVLLLIRNGGSSILPGISGRRLVAFSGSGTPIARDKALNVRDAGVFNDLKSTHLLKEFSELRSSVARTWLHNGTISIDPLALSQTTKLMPIAHVVGIELTDQIHHDRKVKTWPGLFWGRKSNDCQTSGCGYLTSKVFAYTPPSEINVTASKKRYIRWKAPPKEIRFMTERVDLCPSPSLGVFNDSDSITIECAACYDEYGNRGIELKRVASRIRTRMSNNASQTIGTRFPRGLRRWVSLSPSFNRRDAGSAGYAEETYSIYPDKKELAWTRCLRSYVPSIFTIVKAPLVRMRYSRRGECPSWIAPGRLCLTTIEARGYSSNITATDAFQRQMAILQGIAPSCIVTKELQLNMDVLIREGTRIIGSFPPRRSTFLDTFVTAAARYLS